MNAAHSAAPPQSFLSRYPSSWLIVTTLSLLLGQALAAGLPTLPALELMPILLPLPFLFWRGGFSWAVDSVT